MLHEVALVPVPDASLTVRVTTAAGNVLPDAVVEVVPANRLMAPQVAVTDAKGVVTFPDVAAGSLRVTAIATGYVAATMRISPDNRVGVVLTLAPIGR
jgi:hypothetical protein